MLFTWTDEEWGSLIDVQPALLDTFRSVLALLRDRLGAANT